MPVPVAGAAPARATAGITWDEATIAEHDKERGTRMKIDEADTPFARYEAGADLSDPSAAPLPTVYPDPRQLPQNQSPQQMPRELPPANATSLADGLDLFASKLAAAADADAKRDADAPLEWVAEMEASEQKSRDFAAKRKGHYNMAGILGRKFDDEDDEDEDED
eukprot:CAMPEP_0119263486 /NCGR_PEP_ID=MMETSP1329-20130426/2878_1 /TAXON_ID=114041 /ORGANISM="Genus nov. species nov., Strain RCC1024" /LENGTH=164 /DNA_ID=CAMNT_0007263193 /DNA_START=212 /DNA_END=706 /DNA_ORIENTATION=-